MDGADIHELFDIVFAAEGDDVFCAADIDLLHQLEVVRTDVDEPGRVDEDHVAVRTDAVKERLHGLYPAHIAAHNRDARAVQHGHILALARQTAHPFAAVEQEPCDIVADVAAHAGDDKQPLLHDCRLQFVLHGFCSDAFGRLPSVKTFDPRNGFPYKRMMIPATRLDGRKRGSAFCTPYGREPAPVIYRITENC